jgi:hypothetical protein
MFECGVHGASVISYIYLFLYELDEVPLRYRIHI